jgi:hypothetical protein
MPARGEREFDEASRKVGRSLGSAAMHANAKQTEFCTYLSGILLGGLTLNPPLGLWSVDPVSGLVIVPIFAKEGIEGLQVKPAMIAQHRGERQRPLNAIPSSHGARFWLDKVVIYVYTS